jgi:hypothetical protein
LPFLAQNKAGLGKNLTLTLVLKKTPIFKQKVVENRRKL